MASIRLIGRPQPANRERLGIDVLVGQGQRRWFFSTGVVVDSSQWDPTRRLVKGASKDANWANAKAGRTLEAVRARVQQLEMSGEPLTRESVAEGLGGSRKGVPKLGEALLAHLDHLRKTRKGTTVEDYATTARDLQDFLSSQIGLAELTRERLEGWGAAPTQAGEHQSDCEKEAGEL